MKKNNRLNSKLDKNSMDLLHEFDTMASLNVGEDWYEQVLQKVKQTPPRLQSGFLPTILLLVMFTSLSALFFNSYHATSDDEKKAIVSDFLISTTSSKY